MPSSENGKLIATAVGAAVAGAAIAVAAMKLVEKPKEQDTQGRRPRGRKPSYIFDDPMEDVEQVIFPHNHEEKMRRRIAARVAVEEDNLTPRNSVTVRVPATSANFGPGCKLHQVELASKS
jgi:homoserine kinase